MSLFPNYEELIFAGNFLANAKKSGYQLEVGAMVLGFGEVLHIKCENNNEKLLTELCAKFGCSGMANDTGFMITNFNGYTNPVHYNTGNKLKYRVAKYGSAFVLINRDTKMVLDASGVYHPYTMFADNSHFSNTYDLMIMSHNLAEKNKIDLSACCYASVDRYGIHTPLDF